jgi:outer membrane protein assembly factor BamB
MSRILTTGLFVVGLLAAPPWLHAQRAGTGILSQSTALAHGLRRSWVTHVGLDRSRDRIEHLLLNGGTLFVQSHQGVIQALDAETGGRLWVTQVGNPNFPNEAPAANTRFVVTINGSTLFVLHRANGHIAWQRKLDLIPTGAPAVSENWVYSPSLTGQCEAIHLDEPDRRKWNYSSLGRIDTPPLVTQENLAWGTARGFVYFCAQEQADVRFRIDTGDAISAPMGYWPPLVIAASRDGYVYAVDENIGALAWKFSAATAINEPPVALGGSVFVIPSNGGMFCLSADQGREKWFAPRVKQFLAASSTRLYVADRFGQMHMLDLASGGHLDSLPTHELPLKLTNTQNDRLYMASPTGMVLCLREVEQLEPLMHQLPAGRPQPTEAPAEAPAEPAAPAANLFGQ